MPKLTTRGTPKRKSRLCFIIASITLISTLSMFSTAWASSSTTNGEVIIQAEHLDGQGGIGKGYGGSWGKRSDGSSVYMQSDTGGNRTINKVNNWKNLYPHMIYKVNFQTTGRYYIHFRSKAFGDTDNGYFATIDGNEVSYGSGCDYIFVAKTGGWSWLTDGGGSGSRGKAVSFYVGSKGVKTFRIYRRDKGSKIDKIWLTKNTSSTRAGTTRSSSSSSGTSSSSDTATNSNTSDSSQSSTTTATETRCKDENDNDGDGDIDCDDTDCRGQWGSISLSSNKKHGGYCQPKKELTCNDGYDNDQDGKIDYEDSDCSGGSSSTSSSTSGSTGTETACRDNKDNDHDGAVDCQDVDCKGQPGSISLSRTGTFRRRCQPIEQGAYCSDNYDNDQDGKIDCSDNSCSGSSACSGTRASSGDLSVTRASSGDLNDSNDSGDYNLNFDFLANPLSGTTCPEQYDTTCPEKYVVGNMDNGALVISLGGVDYDSVEDISGGATTSFTTTQAGTVSVTFDYQLITTNYDRDECGEAIVAIDGQMVTPAGTNTLYLQQFCGENDTNGWVYQQTVSIHLEAGEHTLALGGYNNKKTGKLETTTVKFQNISISKP